MIWVSFCCLTNSYWSNSKMTSMSYNYNTEYTTKWKHSLAWYDLGIEFYLFVSHEGMKRITKFTRGTSVASYLHEKQTSRIQSLYLYFSYFIKIVPFWLRNIRFLIQNTRSLFYGCHYSPLHRLMSLHRKLNVKFFLMFIVAENTGSVNI